MGRPASPCWRRRASPPPRPSHRARVSAARRARCPRATASPRSTSSAAAAARSSATSTRASSTTSCPGLEAAFVDIGLDKNGFLHVDEIVIPGVEQVKRGRGSGAGTRITDLLKPGQEIVVPGRQGPAQDQGRAAVDGAHDRRALHGLRPDGRGRRRLAPARGQGARPPAQGGQAARPRRRRRDHPHRGPRRAARGLRARAAVPVQAQRGAREARRGGHRARAGLPGGRPLDPRRARHLLRALRARGRRRPQAAPPARLVLRAHRAGARRPRRAVGGRRAAAVRGLRRRAGHRGDAHRAASTCPAAAT